MCTSDVGYHKVYFVEDLETKRRILNTNHVHIDSSTAMDDLVISLIKSI